MERKISGQKAKDVFLWIRKKGTVSKQELQELTGQPASTLTRALDELSDLGMIREVGYGESTGGRRPVLYQVRPDGAYAFGLDISRTVSRLALCDLRLRVVDSHFWRMDATCTPDKLIRETAAVARAMLERHAIPRSSVLGLGIGAVGPLDRTEKLIIDPKHFPADGWEHVHIGSELEQALGFPVLLDNGANTALLAEYWHDAVNHYDHLLYIHAGVGIRSAMMSNGRLVYGAVDMEGSVGQMIIQADGAPPREPGGNYGSWESYASVYALEQAARSALKRGRSSLLTELTDEIDNVSYDLLETAFRRGDDLAKELFANAAVYFGIGLANLLNILHPEKVILGGPLITGNSLFFHQATSVAIRKTYHFPQYQVVFARSRLGEEAVCVGAAALVVDRLTA